MTLYTLKDILTPAREEKYAVGSFNIISIQMIRAIIEAAEEEYSPVIIAFADIHSKIMPLEIIFPLMKKMAKQAKVPVAAILDHGMSFESTMKALKYGASAVMYDGSSLSYEQNVAKTQEVVKVAHSSGVSVEGEIGHVAMEEDNPDRQGKKREDLIYTNPEEAEKFIDETGVDALAISIGTAHGICLEKPKLDFNRLAKINEVSEVPLVLHGGSGVSDDDFKECIQNGVSKINFFSRISNSIANAIKDKLNNTEREVYYQDIPPVILETCKEKIKSRIRVFGSNNRVSF
ncbi:MAG: class II fructose-bisphosphate aldolase [Promethearchaeota archaeon]|nr:MAG: class II fructose-bisphosphate aldolase [Candidatus Lokiarchaeota archaeon]